MRALVVMVGLVVGLVVGPVACGFNNSGTTNPDGGSSGSDVVLPPCVLPDLGADVAGTLSGCSDAGTQDGIRGVARFSNPVNVAIGASGIAYVVDYDSSRLRKIDPAGKVTTIYSAPTFHRPFGIIASHDGYLYIECDDDAEGVHNNTSGTIWKINPADPNSANGAIAIATGQTRPRGLVELGDGRLAITDYLAHVVNIIDPHTGSATLLAGAYGIEGHNNANGASATFAQPWDLVVDPTTGDLIVTEFDNNVLRRVTLNRDVSVYAGTLGIAGHKDGTLAEALFNQPKGMTIDASGAIYITEAGNHDVRKIAAGMVTTVAGATTGGYADANDPMAALYYGVEGLDVSPDGHTLIVADGNDGDGTAFNHVRKITLP
jgi:sugar lactone lactonase YvrE